MNNGVRAAGVAWLITAVDYFYQYTLRSAPAVMIPQLSEAFSLTSRGVASMVGIFYWGTATGVVNFLNFTFSALLGPVFGGILWMVAGGSGTMSLEHYQTAFEPLLYGVGLAIILIFVLRETGSAARPPAPVVARGNP